MSSDAHKMIRQSKQEQSERNHCICVWACVCVCVWVCVCVCVCVGITYNMVKMSFLLKLSLACVPFTNALSARLDKYSVSPFEKR